MRDKEDKKDYDKQYYEEHKEDLSKKRRDRYANPEYRAYVKRYAEEHREEIRARKRKYYFEVLKPRQCKEVFEKFEK